MIQNWIRNEEGIYDRFRNKKCIYDNVWTGIDDLRQVYDKYIDTGTGMNQGNYYAFPHYMSLKLPEHGENTDNNIERDNNKLRNISIVITNWERQFYLPMIMEMYYNQDYRRDLLEFIIVDESTDKDGVRNLVKDLKTKYGAEFKIRFVQNYLNDNTDSYNMLKRTNMGIRLANHDIIITNETDTFPMGRYFLRGICYIHNYYQKALGLPISIAFADESDDKEYNFNDVSEALTNSSVHYRLNHLYICSFDKELIHKIRGHDELAFGFGGHEQDITERYFNEGGKVILNPYIYSGMLKNFPKPIPKHIIKSHTDPRSKYQGFPSFQRAIKGNIINDENWGTTHYMKEIPL